MLADPSNDEFVARVYPMALAQMHVSYRNMLNAIGKTGMQRKSSR